MSKRISSSITQSSSTSNVSFTLRVGKKLREFYISGPKKSGRFILELLNLSRVTSRESKLRTSDIPSALRLDIEDLKSFSKENLLRQGRITVAHLSLPLDFAEERFDLFFESPRIDFIVTMVIVPLSAHSAELHPSMHF